MSGVVRALGLALALWLGCLGAALAQSGPQDGLPRAPLTIMTADGRAHLFDAEVADTAESRNIGMMFRTEMGPGEAMLFLYESPREAAFWMRNTLIPLDIIFVDAGGRIHRIHAMARPRDETALRSGGPILSVIEIPGGRAAELGVAVGDRVASIALTPLWPQKRAEQLR